MIADRLRAEHALRIGDAKTRERVTEMVGLAPEPPAPAPPVRYRPVDTGEVEFKSEDPFPLERLEGRARWIRLMSLLGGGFALLGVIVGLLQFFPTGWLLIGAIGLLAVAGVLWILWRATIRPVPARLAVASGLPPERPRWLAVARALDAPRLVAEPPVDALLVPDWTKGILAVALSMETDDGPLDTRRLVDAIARDEIPSRLPRLPRRSLSAGVQMLIDLSPGMLPFRADMVDVVAQVTRVLGQDGVTVLRFAGNPLAGSGPGPRSTWVPYRPPPTPRPVLVVSDLTLGAEPLLDSQEAISEWLRLSRIVRAARCRVIVLTPQPISDIPDVLRRAMRTIEWDRRTTAASTARAIRHR